MKSFLFNQLSSITCQPFLQKRLLSFIDTHRIVRKPFPHLRTRRTTPFQILLYHRVLPSEDPFAIDPISLTDFEKQIRVLSENFRIIGLPQLLDEIETEAVEKGTICITFDDGYRDNYEYAFPVLQKYRIPATIFLATKFIGTNNVLWPDQILSAIRQSTVTRFEFADAGILATAFESIPVRKQVAVTLLEWLKHFSPADRDCHINRILDHCKVERATGDQRLMLNWDEIRQMCATGISFGAHTRTHPILSSLSDVAKRNEIVGSKRVVEAAIGVKVDIFAYPNGKPADYDHSCKQILRQEGFRCALTTNSGLNLPSTDRFALYREVPWDRNPNTFCSRLLWQRFVDIVSAAS